MNTETNPIEMFTHLIHHGCAVMPMAKGGNDEEEIQHETFEEWQPQAQCYANHIDWCHPVETFTAGIGHLGHN